MITQKVPRDLCLKHIIILIIPSRFPAASKAKKKFPGFSRNSKVDFWKCLKPSRIYYIPHGFILDSIHSINRFKHALQLPLLSLLLFLHLLLLLSFYSFYLRKMTSCNFYEGLDYLNYA